MAFDVKGLAVQKSLATSESETDWSRALENARQSLRLSEMDDPSLIQIALASRSIPKFIGMIRLIYQYEKSHPGGVSATTVLFKNMNESPFSLSDWIDSVHFFSSWLKENSRQTDFLSMLGYLQCCVASPDAQQGGQTFLALVEDMLKVHGFEG